MMKLLINKKLYEKLVNLSFEEELTKIECDAIVMYHICDTLNIKYTIRKYLVGKFYLNFSAFFLKTILEENTSDELVEYTLKNEKLIKKYNKCIFAKKAIIQNNENNEQKEKIENMRAEAINLKSDLDVIIENTPIMKKSEKSEKTIINENSQNAVKTVNAIIETQTNSENMKKTPINNYDDDFSSYFGVVDESKLIVKEEELDPIDEFEDKTDENGKFDFNKYIEQQKLLKQTQKQQDKQAVNNADDF